MHRLCKGCSSVIPKRDQPGLFNMLTVIPWALTSRKERQKHQIFAEEGEAGEAESMRTIRSPLLLRTHDEESQ